MDFDFEVVHRPGAHKQAANAMSRLHKASIRGRKECGADVVDEISSCCILGQIPNVENVSHEERPASLDAPTTAELCSDQQTDAFCQHPARLIVTTPVLRLMIED